MHSNKDKPINVIGAGVSGLSVAYYLSQRGYKVTILEKESSAGGLLGTLKTEQGLVEQAANAFLANKELEEISHNIGVHLIEKDKQAHRRFIFRNGKPRRWPLGLFATLRLFCGVLSFKIFNKIDPNETLQEWGVRVLGEEATEYLLTPAMQGVYAAKPSDLSAQLILQSLLNKKYSKGSLRGSVCAEYGMGEWIHKMRDYLLSNGCDFKFSSKVKELDKNIPNVLAMDLGSTKEYLKDYCSELYSIFENVESTSLTSVTLHFKSEVDHCKGFGCLFPEKEDFNSLGVLFNHHNFPHRSKEGVLSETWIFNDSKIKMSQMNKDFIVQQVLMDRKRLRGVDEKPMSEYIYQWPERIPLYNRELQNALKADLFVEKNIFLMGNYLGELGLSKILHKAKELSHQIEKRAVW